MKKSRLLSLLLAFILIIGASLTLTSCESSGRPEESEPIIEDDDTEEENPEYPVTILGVTIGARPSRVVSLSPALTEKLYDIGFEEVIVGVSDYCDYPVFASTFIKCGTAQIPNLDRILSLEPHVILAGAPLPEEDANVLAGAGVEVVIIPPAKDIRDFRESYINLARLLEGEYAGTRIGGDYTRRIDSRLDELRGRYVPYANEHGRKKVLYLRLLDFNVATGDTLEHSLLDLVGLDNIAAGERNWLYPEELANGDGRSDFEAVEFIFMDEKFVTITMLEQSAYYKGLQATIQDLYIYIDSLVLERQSMRTLDVLEQMARAAYPDAAGNIPFIEDGDGEYDEDEDEEDE